MYILYSKSYVIIKVLMRDRNRKERKRERTHIQLTSQILQPKVSFSPQQKKSYKSDRLEDWIEFAFAFLILNQLKLRYAYIISLFCFLF